MNFFSKNRNIQIIKSLNNKNIVQRTINFTIGCFICALAYNIFIASNHLVPGGIGGIAVIFNYLFGFNNSLVIFLFNIFLLILSFFLLEKEKTRMTILGTLLAPLFIKLTEHVNVWFRYDTSNVLLSAIIGGIAYGLGIGLVFKAGFTTGGTDIINQIISKYGKISLGKSMLVSDGLIVLSSVIVFGINSLLYSMLILYLISYISDRVVLGAFGNKMFYIITDKDKEISDYIINQLGHTTTIFKAKGGYRKEKGNVIMTTVSKDDFFFLQAGIKEIDKDAFFIVTDAYALFGGN